MPTCVSEANDSALLMSVCTVPMRYVKTAVVRPTATTITASGADAASSGLARSNRYAPDRKSTRLNSSHQISSYAVFCLKKKNPQLPVHDGTKEVKHPGAHCQRRKGALIEARLATHPLRGHEAHPHEQQRPSASDPDGAVAMHSAL